MQGMLDEELGLENQDEEATTPDRRTYASSFPFVVSAAPLCAICQGLASHASSPVFAM